MPAVDGLSGDSLKDITEVHSCGIHNFNAYVGMCRLESLIRLVRMDWLRCRLVCPSAPAQLYRRLVAPLPRLLQLVGVVVLRILPLAALPPWSLLSDNHSGPFGFEERTDLARGARGC